MHENQEIELLLFALPPISMAKGKASGDGSSGGDSRKRKVRPLSFL